MRLFLDTSVLLAASGSANGAAREIFRLTPANRWTLISTPYAIEEVLRNLCDLPLAASSDWSRLRSELLMMDDVLTIKPPVVFSVSKDRPILFSALAWADVLITHDRRDFAGLLGTEFYGLAILTPGQFLTRERAAARLKELHQ